MSSTPRKSRARPNAFTVGTKYELTSPKIKKQCNDVKANNFVQPLPNSDTHQQSPNLFDARCHAVSANSNSDITVFKELMAGMFPSDTNSLVELAHAALTSTFLKTDTERSAISISLYQMHSQAVQLETVNKKLDAVLKKKASLTTPLIVQDQYELSVAASQLEDHDVTVLMSHPLRSVNVRSAVRAVISRRLPTTRSRSVVVELSDALECCIRQMMRPDETRKFIYGQRQLKGFHEFDEATAMKIATILSTFVAINPSAIENGYQAPVPDRDIYRGIILQLLREVLSDGPNRRKDPRYAFMPDDVYRATLDTDCMTHRRIQELERSILAASSSTSSSTSTVSFPLSSHMSLPSYSPPLPTISPLCQLPTPSSSPSLHIMPTMGPSRPSILHSVHSLTSNNHSLHMLSSMNHNDPSSYVDTSVDPFAQSVTHL